MRGDDFFSFFQSLIVTWRLSETFSLSLSISVFFLSCRLVWAMMKRKSRNDRRNNHWSRCCTYSSCITYLYAFFSCISSREEKKRNKSCCTLLVVVFVLSFLLSLSIQESTHCLFGYDSSSVRFKCSMFTDARVASDFTLLRRRKRIKTMQTVSAWVSTSIQKAYFSRRKKKRKQQWVLALMVLEKKKRRSKFNSSSLR